MDKELNTWVDDAVEFRYGNLEKYTKKGLIRIIKDMIAEELLIKDRVHNRLNKKVSYD